MRKFALVVLLSLVGFVLKAQSPLQWQQVYGGSGVECGYGVRSCLDQGYIAVGVSSASGPSDGYIVRTDSLGIVTWAKWYGGINIDVLRAVELMPDSGFIIAGYTNSGGNGGYDGWLLRTDKNGDTLWTKKTGTSNWDFFYDVERTRDGGFLCVGGTYGQGAGDEDIYLVRFNGNGDTLWTRTYGGLKTDEGRSVVETEDSLLAVSGFTYSLSDTLGDSWLLRLDTVGNIIWSRTLGDTTVEDKAYGLAYDSIFDILIYCGYSMTSNLGEGFWEGVFYDDTTWATWYGLGVGGFDELYAVRTKPALAPMAFAGTSFSQGAGLGDMWLFSTIGSWATTTYGTVSEDHAYDLDFTYDGGYILCGITYGYGSFSGNMYLVKGDTNLVSTITIGIPEISESGTRTIATAYPVPANDRLNLSITTDAENQSDIVVDIFDENGKLVRSIPNSEFYFPGNSQGVATIEIEDLSDGIYFYSVRTSLEILYSDKFIIAR